MVEVLANRFVVAAGHAVFGDGTFGIITGGGDGVIELDGRVAAGVFAALHPGGNDATLTILNIALRLGLVGAILTFHAQGIAAVADACSLAADAAAGFSSAGGAGLVTCARGGQLLHGGLEL